jgi:hypothetical protein
MKIEAANPIVLGATNGNPGDQKRSLLIGQINLERGVLR